MSHSVLTGVSNGQTGKSAQPATCLLVLLLSVALVALPSMRDELRPRLDASAHANSDARAHSANSAHASPSITRALLSATSKMALEETVIDDGEFNMDELITFNRPHLDHDYQVVKTIEPEKLPGGYLDLPIDEDWPPNLKRRFKKDYPPLVTEENYENFRSDLLQGSETNNFAKGLIANALLSTSRKLGELLGSFPPLQMNNEDLVVVQKAEDRNGSEVKTFTVGGGYKDF